MQSSIGKPAADEYAPFYARYVEAAATSGDLVEGLRRQAAALIALRDLSPAQAAHRYADGKWSVREVIGHLADAERVFAYRLLRIARGDTTPLPGFDENVYVAQAGSDGRPIASLVDELIAVRQASLALLDGLDEGVLSRRGMVNGNEISVRALAFIVAGHVAHHLTILRERYGIAA